MPLEEGTYWKLSCDEHGHEAFETGEVLYRVAESRERGIGTIEGLGGRVEEDGTVLCRDCILARTKE